MKSQGMMRKAERTSAGDAHRCIRLASVAVVFTACGFVINSARARLVERLEGRRQHIRSLLQLPVVKIAPWGSSVDRSAGLHTRLWLTWRRAASLVSLIVVSVRFGKPPRGSVVLDI